MSSSSRSDTQKQLLWQAVAAARAAERKLLLNDVVQEAIQYREPVEIAEHKLLLNDVVQEAIQYRVFSKREPAEIANVHKAARAAVMAAKAAVMAAEAAAAMSSISSSSDTQKQMRWQAARAAEMAAECELLFNGVVQQDIQTRETSKIDAAEIANTR